LAAHRAERPNEFAASAAVALPAEAAIACPFCPGHESTTPPAVFSTAGDDGRWRVRVVPNKFPAVAVDEAAAAGAHEVIVESSRHADRMSALTAAEFADVLEAYRDRLANWRASGRFQYGLVFKNQGAAAGASLAHVHSQLLALPLPPVPVAAELKRARQSFGEQGTCPYCRLIDEERKTKDRVVFERDGLIAFCPYASLQPGEVWLMPTSHEPWLEQRSRQAKSDSLAAVLHTLLVRVETILPRPAYNLLVRTSPWQDDVAPFGHWRIEILPRTNPFAGFELATQIYINPISPTRAAEQLRLS
jgi:UDPglucose--hexose-1-phosphate uridylyltransferase